jgi:predicted acetyltransferase
MRGVICFADIIGAQFVHELNFESYETDLSFNWFFLTRPHKRRGRRDSN